VRILTLPPFYEDAIQDTLSGFEATGSPVITDGAQRKYHTFRDVTACMGFRTGPRRIQNSVLRRSYAPAVTAHTGPFRYRRYETVTWWPMRYAHVPGQGSRERPSALI